MKMSKTMISTFKLRSGKTITKVAVPVTSTFNIKYRTNSGTTFELKPYKLHKLQEGPATTTTLTSDDALNLYQKMSVIRRLEAAAATLYKDKLIRGFCHLYSGQEAVAVGVHAVMRPVDSAITAYRCHSWTYLMGGTALGVLAELTGRTSGCARGKGGSMHMYGPNFYGGNGIVGAQIPLGAGVAMAHKYKGDGGMTFALYGDGAANNGQVFETFNLAKLWSLPITFLCENNKYGLGTHMDRSSASTTYYTRGDYIPGIWADGMDVLTAREAGRFAVDWCISGKGPLVLEMETYRYYGHSMSDPGTSYRTREEIQDMRKTRDPITVFKEKILSNNVVTPEQLKKIDASVLKEVEDAKKHATTDPEPSLEELVSDTYVKSIVTNVRTPRVDKPLPHLSIAKRN